MNGTMAKSKKGRKEISAELAASSMILLLHSVGGKPDDLRPYSNK